MVPGTAQRLSGSLCCCWSDKAFFRGPQDTLRLHDSLGGLRGRILKNSGALFHHDDCSLRREDTGYGWHRKMHRNSPRETRPRASSDLPRPGANWWGQHFSPPAVSWDRMHERGWQVLGKSVTCGPRGKLTQAPAAGASEGLEVTRQERAGPVSGVSGFGRPWPLPSACTTQSLLLGVERGTRRVSPVLRPQNSWAGNPRAESQAPRGAASGRDSGAVDGLTVKPTGIQGGRTGQGKAGLAWAQRGRWLCGRPPGRSHLELRGPCASCSYPVRFTETGCNKTFTKLCPKATPYLG